MKIFKFGGASIKDVEGVKNLVKVVQQHGSENTLVVRTPAIPESNLEGTAHQSPLL